MNPPHASRVVPRIAVRGETWSAGEREIPEEVPVALTYNRAALAVLLATPSDLEDFAVGFSLTEGIIEREDEIEELAIVPVREGVEARM
ncbi:MAG TPA: formate dehydrogenase accessory sulfurtransferase FdhD, partial [Acetobacteraceae bacterium]|nr:formate dehydrogenase accessory sulfurtransferase FdhD [Acetobacteraceae bacterium]